MTIICEECSEETNFNTSTKLDFKCDYCGLEQDVHWVVFQLIRRIDDLEDQQLTQRLYPFSRPKIKLIDLNHTKCDRCDSDIKVYAVDKFYDCPHCGAHVDI